MLKFEQVQRADKWAAWTWVERGYFGLKRRTRTHRVSAGSTDGGWMMFGLLKLESPADLAELFRVLHEAAVVAGWRE